jgi:hypothetical protein
MENDHEPETELSGSSTEKYDPDAPDPEAELSAAAASEQEDLKQQHSERIDDHDQCISDTKHLGSGGEYETSGMDDGTSPARESGPDPPSEASLSVKPETEEEFEIDLDSKQPGYGGYSSESSVKPSGRVIIGPRRPRSTRKRKRPKRFGKKASKREVREACEDPSSPSSSTGDDQPILKPKPKKRKTSE